LEIARIEAGFMQAHVDFMPAGQAIHAKTNIALASLHIPWGRSGDELWADIYYQRELQWSRVTVPCRVVEGAFFDPPRRRATPAADF
jgi:hypothetical protein